ncbi:MAG TPA: hypothetical protein VGM32_00875 [Rhodopila sp.]
MLAQPTRPTAVDPILLQRVESSLARFVGPMARRVVARAAEQAATPDELYASLARKLPWTAACSCARWTAAASIRA